MRDSRGGSFPAPCTTGLGALARAPCGETPNFTINTEPRVSGGASNTARTTTFIAADSTGGAVNTARRLTWKKRGTGGEGGV